MNTDHKNPNTPQNPIPHTSHLIPPTSYLLSLFTFLVITCSAQSPTNLLTTNNIYAEGIQSVTLTLQGVNFGQPIIQLNSGERLELTFDDLLQQNRFLKYTLIHCTHNWHYSPLNQIEYLDGFSEDWINDFSFSFNTIVPYTHYRLLFPTEDMRITKSGNYLLVVYDNDISNPVLTRRLMVLEQQRAGIRGAVTWAQDIRFRDTKQQVDFTAFTGAYSIRNPAMYLRATIVQNGRWDNAIENLSHRTARPGEYGFNFDNLNTNVFNGGNNFRTFDIRTLRSPADRITSINFNDRINQAYVMEDLARPWGAFVTNTTLRGHRIFANRDFSGQNTEDYVLVHFTLRVDFPVADGDLYVFGELTDWRIDPKAKLTFNTEDNYWETSFFCKQGFYNYIYVFVPKGSDVLDDTYIEGSHWQTPNNYTILLYLQEEGTSYDKLIGTATVSIDSNE